MRVHYLKCGTDCPLGGPLFDGFSKSIFGLIPCAAQLIETNEGLVLVDTGYGTEDVRHPHPRLSRTFRAMLNIRFRMQETARSQIEALGSSPRDVRHIVLTHLDFDHAGGIEDFPHARVHVMEAELEAAERKRRGLMDTDRDQRFANQRRLRQLKRHHGDEVTIFCSHDAIELEQMQKLANPRQREPIVPARGLQPAVA